jgi:Uma2 family endonuclease
MAMSSVIEPYGETRRWRRVEYDRLVDLGMFEGERLELLNGLLVLREPQGSPHAATVSLIGQVVATAFGPGWHPRLQMPLALDDNSEPEPDVAVVAGGPRDYLGAHPVTAALVVEVAGSNLRLDHVKSGLYARAGIQDYWIANLPDRVLEVHREPHPVAEAAHGWVYRSVELLRPPATVTPLGAPTTLIRVADLLP